MSVPVNGLLVSEQGIRDKIPKHVCNAPCTLLRRSSSATLLIHYRKRFETSLKYKLGRFLHWYLLYLSGMKTLIFGPIDACFSSAVPFQTPTYTAINVVSILEILSLES